MGWFIGTIVIIAIISTIFKPSKCDVCKLSFNKKYYEWKIDGKKQRLCPNCNARMARKVSSQRFKDRFGK